jgi:hypothetical protein
MPDLATILSGMNSSGLIPQYEALTAPTISGVDTSKYANLTGLGNDYYKNLMDQASRSLNETYFGRNDSLSQRLKGQMASRGLVGSGIETGSTTDFYRNFGDTLAQQQTALTSQQMQEEKDVAEKNRAQQWAMEQANKEIEQQNATNLLDVGKSNLENKYKLGELGLSAASDNMKYQTDFATKNYEQAVNLEKMMSDKYTQMNKTITDLAMSDALTPDAKKAIIEAIVGQYAGTVGDQGLVDNWMYASGVDQATKENNAASAASAVPANNSGQTAANNGGMAATKPKISKKATSKKAVMQPDGTYKFY